MLRGEETHIDAENVRGSSSMGVYLQWLPSLGAVSTHPRDVNWQMRLMVLRAATLFTASKFDGLIPIRHKLFN